MDHPPEKRFDLGYVIVSGLRAQLPGHRIELDRTSEYEYVRGLHTLVHQISMRPVGLDRLLFSGGFSLTTVGRSYDAAMDEAELVADAALSLTSARGVILSSVRCEREPERIARHHSGAEAIISTYRLVARRR